MKERGASESLSWALLAPVLMALVLGLVQTGIWLHGQTVAGNAAALAAGVAAASSSHLVDARQAAHRVAESGGLTLVDIDIERSPSEVSVTVSGRVVQAFDVGLSHVRRTARQPLERVS